MTLNYILKIPLTSLFATGCKNPKISRLLLIRALACIAFLPISANAQTKNPEHEKPTNILLASEVEGTWTTTIDADNGPLTITADFVVNDGKITGTLSNDIGAVEIEEGTIRGDEFEYVFYVDVKYTHKVKLVDGKLEIISTTDNGDKTFFTFLPVLGNAQTKKPLNNEMEVDNGFLKVKLDLTRGGAIKYISESGKTRNIVNIYDEGRYVQQSYYAGKRLDRKGDGQDPNWSPWRWNPIQVGDTYRNRAEILACSTEVNTLYTKCIPMLWDMNNSPAEATMEQWVTLTGNIIKVRNKLTCHRTDDIYGENIPSEQELPAVYPISALKNLYSYFGTSPFTGDTLDNPEVEHLEDGFWGRYQDEMVTEHWMAFVDDEAWGIGVYNPIASNFLAGMTGAPGFESIDGPTSYIAPIKKVALKKRDVFEYDYYLIIGALNEIRLEIYKLNKQQ